MCKQIVFVLQLLVLTAFRRVVKHKRVVVCVCVCVCVIVNKDNVMLVLIDARARA